jgi:DNA-directed RNA polymerase subunit beta'
MKRPGNLIAEADTNMISADLYQRLLEEKVTEISLYLNDDETGEATEKMQINISDADAAAYLKEKLEHSFNWVKRLSADIVNAAGKVIAQKWFETMTEKEINQRCSGG